MSPMVIHFFYNQVDWAFSHACSSDRCSLGSISVGKEHTVVTYSGKPVTRDLLHRYHAMCAPLPLIDVNEPLHTNGMEPA